MSKPLNANVVTLHVNGHPMQNLQAGQKLRFSAKANERYRLVKKSGQSDELLSGALATRHGLDLQLDELNGVQVLIENFFQACKDQVCSVELPAHDGAVVLLGGDAPSEGQLVYAFGPSAEMPSFLQSHGVSSEGLISVAKGDDMVSWIPLGDLQAWNWLPPLVAGPVLVSNLMDDAVASVITGNVLAGPVMAGHGLVVKAYRADGSPLGAQAVVNADGTFSLTLGDDYRGPVLIKVSDSSAGNDYFDEATGQPKDLSVDLRAITVIPAPGTYTINVNVLTELAVRQLGLSGGADGQSSEVFTGLSEAEITNANHALAQALGLKQDLVLGQSPVAIVDLAGATASGANDYGKLLAALSGAELGSSTGDVLDSLTGMFKPDGLSIEGINLLMQGAAQISGRQTLVTEISDLTQQVNLDATILGTFAIQTIGQDNQLNVAEADAGVRVSGQATAQDQVLVRWGDSTLSATADGQGQWHVTFSRAEIPVLKGEPSIVSLFLAPLEGGETLVALRGVFLNTRPPEIPDARLTLDSGNADLDCITSLAVLSVPTNTDSGATVEYRVKVGEANFGDWRATYTPPTTDGHYTVQVRQTDLAGNVSDSQNLAFTLDTFAATPDAALSTDTGSSDLDLLSNNAALAAPSNTEPGASVEYRVQWGAGDFGDWTSNYIAPTENGDYTVQVRQTDVAGNVSGSQSIRFALDNIKPAGPDAALSTDSGSSGSDSISSSAALTAPTNTETGATMEYRIQAGAGSFGDWSGSYVAPTTNGVYTVEVRQTDVAGNVSDSQTITFTLDDIKPSVPDAVLSTDSGGSGSDSISSSAALTAPTNTESGATVEYRVKGGVGSFGDWSGSYVAPTTNGAYTVEVRQTDVAGNVSDSQTITFTLDDIKPVVPDAVLSTDTGSSSSDSISSSAALTAPTNTERGATVEYRIQAGAGSFGDWSGSYVAPTTNGAYTVEVRQTDVAGNVSGSQSITFTLDDIKPSVPDAVLSTDSGSSGSDSISSSAALTAPTNTESGATVEYRIQAGAGSFGDWSGSYVAPTTNGAYTVEVRQTDVAGNVSDSQSISFTLDDIKPVVPDAALSADTGSLDNDSITSSAVLKVPTNTESGATVEYRVQAGAGSFGSWSRNYTAPTTDGAYTVEVRQSDVAGNVSDSQSIAFTLDTAAPTPNAALTTDTGSSVVDAITNSAALTAPTNTESGATVEYRIKAGSGSFGSWSSNYIAPTTDGDYTVEVRQTDVAGNVSSSQSIAFMLDATQPATSNAALTTDSGSSGSDGITNSASLTAPTNTETGATVAYRVQAGAGSFGSWSSTYTAPTTDGAYTVEVRQTDVAGNHSDTQSINFTLDTTVNQLTTGLSFQAQPSVGNGTGFRLPALGDINGDGRPDMVVGQFMSSSPVTVQAYLQQPDGSFVLQDGATGSANPNPFGGIDFAADVPTGEYGDVLWVALIDVGSDGKTDMLVSYGGTALAQSGILYYRNTGTAQEPSYALQPTGDNPFASVARSLLLPMATGDVDGDGDQDLVLGHISSSNTGTTTVPVPSEAFEYWRNNGDGSFSQLTGVSNPLVDLNLAMAQINVKTSGFPFALPYLGDFNGDGRLDMGLFLPFSSTSPIVYLPGDGQGGFSFTGLSTMTGLPAFGVPFGTAADINGDGLTDFMMGGEGAVSLYYQSLTQAVGLDRTQIRATKDILNVATYDTADLKLQGNGAEANAGIDIDVNGNFLAHVQANAQGQWSYTWTGQETGFAIAADKTYALTVKQTDAAGNTSVASQAYTLTVAVPPPTLSDVHLSADTGALDKDFITNTANQSVMATLSRELRSDEVVYGVIDGTTWVDITSKVMGTTLTWDGVVLGASGVLSIRVGNGITDNSALHEYVVDTTAPTPAPNATLTTDTGSSGSDAITSSAALTGPTNTETGATVAYRVKVGAGSFGNWSSTYTAPTTDGDYTVEVRQSDVAGNVSDSQTIAFTLDTAAETPNAALNSDTGSSGADGLTNSAALKLPANTESGASVEYRVKAGEGSFGDWSGSYVAPTTHGAYTVEVRQTDVAGNVSDSQTITFTLDDIKPSVPDAALSADSGSSGSDAITSSAALTAPTNTESGAIVEYRIQAGAGSFGSWSSTYTAPTTEGDYTVEVRQTDLAGNVSDSQTITFTLDDIKPSVPDAALSTDSGSSGSDSISSSAVLTAPTNTESGASVEYRIQAGSGSFGEWSSTYTAPTSVGEYTVEVRQTDVAGNVSDSQSISFTLDDIKPEVPDAALSTDTGSLNTDNITNSAMLNVPNNTEAGATVAYRIQLGSDNFGEWTDVYTAPTTHGAYTVEVRQTDAAGNVSDSQSISFTLDNIKPAVPDAALTTDSGSSNTDSITNSSALNPPSNTEADATVEYRIQAGFGSFGDWSRAYIAPSTFGVYTVEVRQTDVAGNVSDSQTLNFKLTNEDTVDTTPPTIAITANATELLADDETIVTFTLSEASTDFSNSSITVTGGTLSDVIEVADNTYEAFFTPDADTTTTATIGVASGAFTDLGGNANADGIETDNAIQISVNSVRPGILSLEVNAPQKQLVLTYDQNLSDQLPSENLGDFFIVEVDGVAQIVDSLSVSGAVLTVTLSAPLPEGDLRFEYKDPAGYQNGAIRAASNNNDAAGFILGTVADGYIQGAQVYIDTDADGLADAGEIRQGVTTSAKGSFLLPTSAPTGTLLAMGGADVSTGLAQTTPLKAPSGSRVINPLTTLVQELIEQAALATPAQTLSVQQASDLVAAALGLSLPAGKNLSNYDPLAAKDSAALATQKAAAQLGTLAALVALDQSDTADDVAVADQMYATLALQILNPATTTVDLTDTTVWSGLNLQPKTVARMGTFSSQIDSAANLTSITDAQKRVADNTGPTMAISSDKSSLGVGQTALITFTLNEASTDFVEGDITVTGGTLSNFSGSGKNYSATFTPTPNSHAVASISVASGQFNDLALNTNSDGAETNNVVSITVDTQALTLEGTTPADGDLVGPTSDLVLRFSKPVQAVAGKKIHIVNDSDSSSIEMDAADSSQVTVGPDGTVTLNPTADLTMGKNYHIAIDAGAFVDLFGSAFEGIADNTALNFTVPDPAISLNAMATDNVVNAAENGQTLTLGGTLSSTMGAGVLSSFAQGNFTVKLTSGVGDEVDATMISYDSTTGAWRASVDAGTLVDGQTYSVQVAASSAGLSASSKGSLRVDTSVAAPSAQLAFDTGSSSSDGITTNGAINLSGLETGATWQYRTGGSSDWTLGSGSSFTLQAGTHSVQVRQADAAGNLSQASTAKTVVVDTTVPTIAISSNKTSLSVGQTAGIMFTLSESSTDFSESNIVISGGKLSSFQGNGTTYSAIFTPTANSTTPASISVTHGQFSDVAGNKNLDGNDADNTVTMTVDTVLGAPVTAIELSAIALGSGGFVINGQGNSDYSGYSVSSAGDVNGDGLIDLIVGAYGGDPTANSNAGRSYVVFGKTSTTSIDLSAVTAQTGGFVINGQFANDSSGRSVSSAGDVNGDGLADLIVGADLSDPNNITDAGRSYVVFGKTSIAPIELSAIAAKSGGFVINGQTSSGFSGYSVSSAGDVNGDGLADLIVGAYGARFGDGLSYVVFGKTSGDVIELSALPGSASGFLINGDGSVSSSGFSVSGAGDVNGDGFADVIVGVYKGLGSAGRSYVVFGKANGATVELSDVLNSTGGFVINGDIFGSKSGYSVSAAGDVNGDGLGDVIVGAYDANSAVGRSYVVFGKTSGDAINLSAVLDFTRGLVINGEGASSNSGFSVSEAGDVNGDGLADLIVGAYGANNSAGRSYVVFGKQSDTAIELSDVSGGLGGFVINGDGASTNSGSSVSAAGDVNGDGLADLIVGAYQSNNSGGRSYVIFGSTSGAFRETAVDWLGTDGDETQDDAGVAKTLVAGAGNDVLTATAASVLYGGAGNDTLIVNATLLAALQSPLGKGGNDDRLSRVDGGTGIDMLALSGSRQQLDLSAIADTRLQSIEHIDLTGSGNNLLRVTAEDVQALTGMNWLNSSTASSLGWTSTGYTWTSIGHHQLVVDGNSGDQLYLDAGWTAATGSLTKGGHEFTVYNKGAAQLLVDNHVSVLMPVPIMLSAVAASTGGFVINGQCASDLSGYSVSSAGDVNGDGLDDLIVGAHLSDPTAGSAAGRAYVVFGQSGTTAINLSAVAAVGSTLGFVINGSLNNDNAGFSVSGAGDVNGDGKADIIVGAPGADSQQFGVSNLSTGWDGGRAYVIFGKTDGGAVNLLGMSSASNSWGFMINGLTAGDGTGNSVAAAGDVNGDGLADVMVGAKAATVPDADAFGSGNQAGAGRAYIVFGKTDTAVLYLSSVVNASASGGFVINGRFGNDYAGIAVAGGSDINGDGLDDVIVGADGADTVLNAQGTGFAAPGWDGGQAFVVFGKTTTSKVNTMNIAATAGSTEGFLINGLTASDYTGTSVAMGGDVNGDGLSDILVGAKGSDVGGSASGRAYVIFGKTGTSAVQVSDVAQGLGGFAINGLSAGDEVGYSVASAGDMNGDGLADLIVGAHLADPVAGTNAGRTYVVFGKTGTGPINLSAVAAGHGGFVINGQAASDESGLSVSAAGDVDGDGLMDLLVGAPNSDPTTGTNAGRSYVIFGSNHGILAMNKVDVLGTSGVDSLTDDGLAITLVAGRGNDTLTATAGSVLYGGAGDDLFVINADMLTALENSMGRGGNAVDSLANVAGGDGLDTLALSGTEQHLNLLDIGGSRITGIEVIDLTGQGDNVISPTESGILAMGGINVYNSLNGWSGLAASVAKHQVRVEGNTGDWVNLPSTWSYAGDASWNNATYKIYNSGNAQMLINSPVQVRDDLPPSITGIELTSATGMQAGFLKAGSIVTATVSFSEVVKVNTSGGAPGLLLDIGGSAVGASYVSGNGTTELVFSYAIQSGQNASDGIAIKANGFVLNGAVILDSTRRAATLSHATVPVNANFKVDTFAAAPNASLTVDATDGGAILASTNIEPGALLEYRLKGPSGTFSDWGTTYTPPANDGSANGAYTLQLRQTDVVGNVSLTKTLSFGIGQYYSAIELSDVAAGNGGFVLNGPSSYSSYSSEYSVQSAGDVNGDGLDDLILGGVPYADAYVVLGKTSTDGLNLSALANGVGGFVIGRHTSFYSFENVSAVGDINGDGLADLIVGVSADALNAGRSYVVFGKTNTAAIDLSAVAASSGGFVINGASANDLSGTSVASAGDVNGDGLVDLIIGAPIKDSENSLSYVVFGKTDTSAVNLSAVNSGVGGFVINGQANSSNQNISVSSVGDVNGDGLADLIVAAKSSGVGVTDNSYVVFGRTDTTPINLTALTQSSGGFVIHGETEGAPLNPATFYQYADIQASGAGDVNGDGLADLIVMATPPNSKSRSYVVFGKSDMSTIELSAVTAGTGGFFIDLRMASSAGDVNGDGLADLIVSDKYGSSSFVVFGQTGTGRIDLSAVAAGDGGFQIKSSPVMLAATTDLSAAGDVNGDGLADLILSGKNLVNGADSGYVIFGATNGAFHQTRVDQLGGDGDDVLSDGGVVKTLVAGAGNDTLAATAASVLYGGAGDDVFEVGSAMVTALQSPYGLGGNLTQLARIDGGSGMDTLRLSGSGQVIDLSQISGSAMTVLSDARLESIEVIDMTGSGNQTLKLTGGDVLDLSHFNVFDETGRVQLMVKGNAGDTLDLTDGDWATWIPAGTTTLQGTAYATWNHVSSKATVYVDQSVTVQSPPPRPGPVELFDIATGVGGFAINGQCAFDNSGFDVSSAGDVNGDGFDDLIIGLNLSLDGYPNGAYPSFVVFGKANNTAVNLSAVLQGVGGFAIKTGDSTGPASVAGAGDLNGDGLDDVVVVFQGLTHVVFGRQSSSEVVLSNVANGEGGFVINAVAAGDNLVSRVSAAGDVNGDGMADLILGASGANGMAGRSYVVFGQTGTTPIQLTSIINNIGGFVINGVSALDSSGDSVSSAGDVNGDGLADLIVGADGANGAAGRSYVVFGQTAAQTVNLSSVANNVGGFVINGQAASDRSGQSVASAGDVNGDGLADLIVGANNAQGLAGRSYVIFGQTAAVGINLSAIGQGQGGFVINGQNASDHSGWSVSSAGDVNGDGLADLIVGAPQSRSQAGRSYVVFGQTDTSPVELSAVAAGLGGFAINGQSSPDGSGTSVSAAGDVNGDGLADLVVGAPVVENNLGKSYVIFGSTSGAFHESRVDWLGSDGSDVQSDGGVAMTLVAGAGNDTLAATAASVLYGGAGDDVFEISSAMITALQSPYGLGGNLTQLARIDGGSGMDTLKLMGSGQSLDLTQIAGSAMTPESDARLESIEVIDMTGSGDHTLKLLAKDVLDLSRFNVFATTGRTQLMVTGQAGDTLDLADATGTIGWTHGTATTLNNVLYDVWNHNTSLATVYVNQGVLVA
ncbi:MAG: hypothetical protein CFE38_11490 [Comamonadaceae bacterium PBBC1]|nr:MAG: hypothetical protein CFE38_11490 [Comamonadaceae bacterium PBBC1]